MVENGSKTGKTNETTEQRVGCTIVGSTDIFAKSTEGERERCLKHIRRVLENPAIEDTGHKLLCVLVALTELKMDGKIIP